MLNISTVRVKARLKIPANDSASELYIASLHPLALAICEGLLRSSLEKRSYREVFRLSRARVYKNLRHGRFPLLLSSGFVSNVVIKQYVTTPAARYDGQPVRDMDVEIDHEAGVIYVSPDIDMEELVITFDTGIFNYPVWVEELYLQNLEYSRDLPNDGSETIQGGSVNYSKVISTLMERSRRPLGNMIKALYVQEVTP